MQPRRRDAAALQRAWTLDPADLHAAGPLGRGSQSDVLHGKWQGLRVAIKQPRVSGAAAEEFVRREVRALSRVQHPNVVRLYGVCSEPQLCVVMAFAEGGALDDQIATRSSSLLEVFEGSNHNPRAFAFALVHPKPSPTPSAHNNDHPNPIPITISLTIILTLTCV